PAYFTLSLHDALPISAEILWVVETGMPSFVAIRITVAELVSAAKPLMGCSFTILCPRVLMIRHPPTAVPVHMTIAQVTLIQRAIPMSFPGGGSGVCRNQSQPGKLFSWPALVAANNVKAMIPIVFCASLVPCMKPMAP